MMIRSLSVSVATVLLAAGSAARAQFGEAIQRRLLELAEKDPAVARVLTNLEAARDARTYTREEFVKHVEVQWQQYRVSQDGKYILGIDSGGSCSIGGILGGGVTWTDGLTGQRESLSYEAAAKYASGRGLFVEVSIRENDEPPIATEHVFENLQAVTVRLREEDDGTKHIARFVPVVRPKEEVRDYADRLTMRLSSAVLLADGQYAGQFTVAGPIIGIVSGDAGMRFEFGMKPFPGAAPLGKTDGRTISFQFDGRDYRLISTEPITSRTGENSYWTVYVRGQSASMAGGSGTHAYTYDSVILQDVLKDVMP